MKRLILLLILPLSFIANAQTIDADDADVTIKNGNTMWGWIGQTTARLNSNTDNCYVVPFELPTLPVGKTLSDASFSFNVESYSNQPTTTNIDLYGIGFRNSSDVLLTDDNYAGANDGSDAVKLQDNILVGTSTEVGTITSSSSPSLVAYINAQYSNGAVGGDFIFLRLSPDQTGNTETWNLSSANSSSKVPQLTLTFGVSDNPTFNSKLSNQIINEGATSNLDVSATDPNGDDLTFSSTNLPSFAILNQNVNGTASIDVTPQIGDAGTYNNINIEVTDGTYTDEQTFSITVKDPNVNTSPVIATITNQTVEENKTKKIAVSVSDADGNTITIAVNNKPTFATLIQKSNGEAELVLSPSNSDIGNYTDVEITANDGKVTVSEKFNIEVKEEQSFSGIAYYCDPVNGSMSNDGSESSPWKSLKEVVVDRKQLVAGDVLFLKSGDHGTDIYFKGSLLGTGTEDNYITIKAVEGESPIVGKIQVDFTSYWAFEGIIFDAPNCNCGTSAATKAVFIAKPSSNHLKIKNCLFRSGAEGSSGWSYNDWYDKSTNAIIIQSPHVVFDNNTIRDAMFALQVEAQFVDVTNNLIDNYGADAIRALASDCKYIGNIVRDAYLENYEGSVGGKPSNHDDALQMYDTNNPASGIISNVVIRNNKFFQFADPITQAMVDANLVSYLAQGIFQTDGKGINIVIENNVVVTDHYHGITLIGTDNCRIQNNTVVKTTTSYNAKDAGALTWIQMKADKQGNECKNSIIRNNLTTKLTPWTYVNGTNMTSEGNVALGLDNYSSYFVDADNYNFQLKEDSPAIGRGVNSNLTEKDIEGNPRKSGDLTDAGAYEFQVDTSIPAPNDQDVYASAGDGYVIDPSSVAYTGENVITSGKLKIGSHQGGLQAGNTDLSSIVIPFQLPTIPTGKEISDASLKVFVSEGTAWFTFDNKPTHLDLYGLTHRSSSDILESDYFTGDFGTGNGSDAGIADNFFTKNVASGSPDTERWEETTTAENTSLANYIKGQYATGAQAGDYIFLRLSIDNASMELSQYFKVHSSEDINVPVLKIIYRDLTLGENELLRNNISVYPNPVINNTFTLDLGEELEGEINTISIYSLNGVEIYRFELNNSSELKIVLPREVNSGIYLLNVSNNKFTVQKKLIIK